MHDDALSPAPSERRLRRMSPPTGDVCAKGKAITALRSLIECGYSGDRSTMTYFNVYQARYLLCSSHFH
ncbi:MAG: hypothetical protein ACI8WM_002520 [Burkholderiaceae bacterium]|jgi:hypothetical protein